VMEDVPSVARTSTGETSTTPEGGDA
jgi:hypothetical protein